VPEARERPDRSIDNHDDVTATHDYNLVDVDKFHHQLFDVDHRTCSNDHDVFNDIEHDFHDNRGSFDYYFVDFDNVNYGACSYDDYFHDLHYGTSPHIDHDRTSAHDNYDCAVNYIKYDLDHNRGSFDHYVVNFDNVNHGACSNDHDVFNDIEHDLDHDCRPFHHDVVDFDNVNHGACSHHHDILDLDDVNNGAGSHDNYDDRRTAAGIATTAHPRHHSSAW
jgi:hypothetical protein